MNYNEKYLLNILFQKQGYFHYLKYSKDFNDMPVNGCKWFLLFNFDKNLLQKCDNVFINSKTLQIFKSFKSIQNILLNLKIIKANSSLELISFLKE
jgi:hypothetical protein